MFHYKRYKVWLQVLDQTENLSIKFLKLFIRLEYNFLKLALVIVVLRVLLLVSRMVNLVSSNVISFNNASKIACSICLEVPSKFPLCTTLEELLYCIEREFSIV